VWVGNKAYGSLYGSIISYHSIFRKIMTIPGLHLDFVFLASVAIGMGWKIQAVDGLELDRVVGEYFFNYIWTGP
jgi:hypothetical protein